MARSSARRRQQSIENEPPGETHAGRRGRTTAPTKAKTARGQSSRRIRQQSLASLGCGYDAVTLTEPLPLTSPGMSAIRQRFRPGSNNWVISGAHTASGKPLLSNDMHLDLACPNTWYEAHLTCRRLRRCGSDPARRAAMSSWDTTSASPGALPTSAPMSKTSTSRSSTTRANT